VEYGSVTLRELRGDAAAAAMAELAAGRRGHARSGFLTGRPQVRHGMYPALSRQTGHGANAQPSTRLPQWQSHIP
jgi:hypothetical protein